MSNVGILSDLYPSAYEDWIDPKSILQVICVSHAEIGELSKGSRSHKKLLEESIFFYNSFYHPSLKGDYGRVEPIALPEFLDEAWPLPDMATTEAFRAQMREDFFCSMKPSIGSKTTRLSWFMPITVMVDLFAVASTIHRTQTSFVFKEVSQNLFASLIDKGWQEKICVGADIIKCVVDPTSVTFKYHIGRSTLYGNFCYYRSRMKGANLWEQIDQSEPAHVVTIECEMGDWHRNLEVGFTWSLALVRSEVELALGSNAPDTFLICIVEGEHILQKVRLLRTNIRNLI